MSTADACPISGLRKIILATDGSDHSERALTQAVNLSKACGSVLHAVSVVEMNKEYAALAPKAIDQAGMDAKQFLDAVIVCAAREKVKCETVVLHGENVAELLVDQAVKLEADLIVMGRQGRKKGLKKLLVGSVTSNLVSYAPCKVLVVP